MSRAFETIYLEPLSLGYWGRVINLYLEPKWIHALMEKLRADKAMLQLRLHISRLYNDVDRNLSNTAAREPPVGLEPLPRGQ